MTRGSHAYAFGPDSEPERPLTDPITDETQHSLARLIQDHARAIATPRPAGRPSPPLNPAMGREVAEQVHRHQLETNELFHAYEREQMDQRTESLRQSSEQQRRRSRHATDVAILRMWLGFLATVAAEAVSIAWFVIHIGCSPSTLVLSGVGGLLTFGGGVVAISHKARERRNRAARQYQVRPEDAVPRRRPTRP